MDPNDITHVFFQAPATIVDCVHPNTGRGVYGDKTLDEASRTYLNLQILTMEDAIARKDAAWRTPPTACTPAQFVHMREILPPKDWTTLGASESFKLHEHTSGTITAIYIRIGAEGASETRYYHMHDDASMTHPQIVASVLKAEQ